MTTARGLTVCAQPRCPNLTDQRWCDDHADLRPKAWATSTRKTHRNGSGWAEQARAKRVIRRDRGICYVCGLPGADRADHVIPLAEGGADDESNMAAIHQHPCHDRKTHQESQRAKARQRDERAR